MRKMILTAGMFSVFVAAAAAAGQDMMKRQEPSMRSIPTMKPIAMTNKKAPKRAGSKKRVRKGAKKKAAQK